MKKIITLIDKTSQRPLIYILLALLVLLNIMMNAPGLPTSTPSMQKISLAFTPFDLQFKGYTVESFTTDLNNLGENGRAIYKNFMLCDILFPAVYALFFSSLIFLVFRKKQNWLQWIFLIPILTGLTDYIENIFIAIAFAGYPSSSHSSVALASFSTQLKMLFNALLVLSLLTTLGAWVTTFFKKVSNK